MAPTVLTIVLVGFCALGWSHAQAAAETAKDAEGWSLAVPGRGFHFPEDHGPHPDFRTEWWYFTGNLKSADGRELGFELTFFRHGYLPPATLPANRPAFATGDVKFAHFTVTDVGAKRFYAAERTSRGAFAEAGFGRDAGTVWIDDWRMGYDGRFHLAASAADHAMELDLDPLGPPVLQGDGGFSRKAAGEGRASYYYSIPRLRTAGRVRVGKTTFEVTGISWFDREWATNQLAPQQAGWDWFAIQLDDGASLMLYQVRLKDGGTDPFSSAKYVGPDGSERPLRREDFSLTPTRWWQGPGSRYPVGWRLDVPTLGLALTVTTPVDDQELRLAVHYWEGCIRLSGTENGSPRTGLGYMELTGYEGGVTGLSAAGRSTSQ